MDPLDLLRTLLEPARLEVLGVVARTPASLDEVTARTGVAPRRAARTLAPLVQAGLVVHDGNRYVVEAPAWRALAQQLPQAAPAHPRIGFGMTDEEAEVLGRFNPDHANLRRHLVDEGLLDREAGVYWRSGGRVV